MLKQFNLRYRTLRDIQNSPQYSTWTFNKLQDQKLQYFYSQIFLLFSILIHEGLRSVLTKNDKQWWIYLFLYGVIQLSQMGISIFCAIFNTRYNISMKIQNLTLQIIMLMTQISNQVFCLQIGGPDQQISQLVLGYLIAWTTYHLPSIQFKLLLTIVSSIIFLIYDFSDYGLNALKGLTYLGFYLGATLASLVFEYNQITQYQKCLFLIRIIERIPNAMCIVDSSKTQMLYSNKQFKQLAITLNEKYSKECKPGNIDIEKQELNFLQNLKLNVVNNDGFQISNFTAQMTDEGITNDQYRIKNVIFNKDQLITDDSQPSLKMHQNPKINDVRRYKQQLNYLTQQQNHLPINKAFISDMTLQMELKHQPQTFIQSSIFKKRQSNNQINLSNYSPLKSPQSPTKTLIKQHAQNTLLLKRGSMMEQFLEEKSVQSAGSPNSIRKEIHRNSVSQVHHKLKFMVQLVENCNIFEADEQLQIYFISELSPFILKTKVNKLEQIKKKLLRSISHELVTYLNGAQGYIIQAHELLQQDTSSKIEINHCVSLAQKLITLQIHKIQDIFVIKDILSGEFVLINQQFSLGQQIEDCISLMHQQSQSKGLVMEYKLDQKLKNKQPLMINSDEKRFRQVLLNLLSNALRFTYKGNITVEVEKAEFDSKFYEDEQQFMNQEFDLGDILKISVSDTGTGMERVQLGILNKKILSDDDHEKISKDSVGVGMGLMLCKQILRIMCPEPMNSLFVESEKNEGSSFYFFLRMMKPMDNDTSLEENQLDEPSLLIEQSQNVVNSVNLNSEPYCETAKAHRIPVFYPRLKSFKLNDRSIFRQLQESQSDVIDSCQCNRVLVVDDEAFNIEIISYMMQKMGFEIDIAYNGLQAIQKLEEAAQRKCHLKNCSIYRCILMDINMPVMNGWKAVVKIKEMESKKLGNAALIPRIPIIAVTAFGNLQDKIKCVSSGFDHIIVKPATQKILMEAFIEMGINFNINSP